MVNTGDREMIRQCLDQFCDAWKQADGNMLDSIVEEEAYIDFSIFGRDIKKYLQGLLSQADHWMSVLAN